jgi:hypothetical protein
MIDVYAAAGTFSDTSQLSKDLAATLMAVEGVPDETARGRTRNEHQPAVD